MHRLDSELAALDKSEKKEETSVSIRKREEELFSVYQQVAVSRMSNFLLKVILLLNDLLFGVHR